MTPVSGAEVARDPVSHLAVIRVPEGIAPALSTWSPRRFDYPRFLLAADTIARRHVAPAGIRRIAESHHEPHLVGTDLGRFRDRARSPRARSFSLLTARSPAWSSSVMAVTQSFPRKPSWRSPIAWRGRGQDVPGDWAFRRRR